MKSATKNKFVIIIPTFKQEVLLQRTLESLVNCIMPDNLWKIIIVENGPKGSIEAIIKNIKTSNLLIEYTYVKLANKSNALNTVLQNINNMFVILFDDDIRLDKQVLVAYASAFEEFGKGFFGFLN